MEGINGQRKSQWDQYKFRISLLHRSNIWCFNVRNVCNKYLLLGIKSKENEGVIMDLKGMLVKLAEEQADKMREEAMNHLASDEMSDSIATAINKRIDIPFVSEEKEQIFFEKIVDVVTDVLEGVFKGK